MRLHPIWRGCYGRRDGRIRLWLFCWRHIGVNREFCALPIVTICSPSTTLISLDRIHPSAIAAKYRRSVRGELCSMRSLQGPGFRNWVSVWTEDVAWWRPWGEIMYDVEGIDRCVNWVQRFGCLRKARATKQCGRAGSSQSQKIRGNSVVTREYA